MSARAEQLELRSDIGGLGESRECGQAAWVALFAHCRGWVSLAVLIPAAVLAGLSPLPYRPGTWAHFAFECVGWSLFLAGGGMRWWSTLYIGDRKSCELVSSGPYSMTRNPIYLGTLLLTLAVAVFAQSLLFLLTVFVVATAYTILTILAEEHALRRIHGDGFDEYCRRVPRFIPNLRLFHSPPTVVVHVKGLGSELIRACRWVWIPLLCDFVTHLRCESWWPNWTPLP